MSNITLETILAMADPATNWDWEVELPEINGLKLKSEYVEDMELPLMNIGAVGRHSAGSQTFYPGENNTASFNMTFYEDVSYLSTTYLLAWQALVVDGDGNYGLPHAGVGGGYKKDITFKAFDGKNGVAMEGVLHGCWPSAPTGLSFSSQASERIRINCSFSVDYTEINKNTANGNDSFFEEFGNLLEGLGDLGDIMPNVTSSVNDGLKNVLGSETSIGSFRGVLSESIDTVTAIVGDPFTASPGSMLGNLGSAFSGLGSTLSTVNGVVGAASSAVRSAQSFVGSIPIIGPMTRPFMTNLTSRLNQVSSVSKTLTGMATGHTSTLAGLNSIVRSTAGSKSSLANMTSSALRMQTSMTSAARGLSQATTNLNRALASG